MSLRSLCRSLGEACQGLGQRTVSHQDVIGPGDDQIPLRVAPEGIAGRAVGVGQFYLIIGPPPSGSVTTPWPRKKRTWALCMACLTSSSSDPSATSHFCPS